jgi:hypothetical protein
MSAGLDEKQPLRLKTSSSIAAVKARLHTIVTFLSLVASDFLSLCPPFRTRRNYYRHVVAPDQLDTCAKHKKTDPTWLAETCTSENSLVSTFSGITACRYQHPTSEKALVFMQCSAFFTEIIDIAQYLETAAQIIFSITSEKKSGFRRSCISGAQSEYASMYTKIIRLSGSVLAARSRFNRLLSGPLLSGCRVRLQDKSLDFAP